MSVGFSRRARRDLEEIYDYIATDNVAAARRVLRAIQGAVELVGRQPHIGIRNARSPELRSKLVSRYPYRVHYLVQGTDIFIVHIRHTARRSWQGE